MIRRYKETFFIDRDLNDPYQGWGWIEIDQEVAKRLKIYTERPKTRFFPPEILERLQAKGKTCTTDIRPPSRGRTAGRKFIVNTHNEIVYLSAQKSLSIGAVCTWVKTWAAPDAKIVTPGNRTISLAGEAISKSSAFVYFVQNADGRSIKIGKTKNLEKRLRSLQTGSSSKLQLLKSIHVASEAEAVELETSLHRKFFHLRETGEWFRAEVELLEYLKI